MNGIQRIAAAQTGDGQMSTDDLIAAYERGIDGLRPAMDGMTPEPGVGGRGVNS